jgi:hypothetical protein
VNFENFFSRHAETDLQLSEENVTQKRTEVGNDALFQLPFIALVILMLAKDRRKPSVSELGQFVGESLENSMPGFKGSSQHLGWSATLRIRTVTALNFLDYIGLVEIDERRGKILITEFGKKVALRATARADDLAYNLSQVARSYRNICIARQLDLQLE